MPAPSAPPPPMPHILFPPRFGDTASRLRAPPIGGMGMPPLNAEVYAKMRFLGAISTIVGMIRLRFISAVISPKFPRLRYHAGI